MTPKEYAEAILVINDRFMKANGDSARILCIVSANLIGERTNYTITTSRYGEYLLADALVSDKKVPGLFARANAIRLTKTILDGE